MGLQTGRHDNRRSTEEDCEQHHSARNTQKERPRSCVTVRETVTSAASNRRELNSQWPWAICRNSACRSSVLRLEICTLKCPWATAQVSLLKIAAEVQS
ncbi:hypothetical protein AAFF_G00279530 [Aldrovandia affinis]|uniref:Uncharacterized protein n=1 Tax=Aldrovandia affinis TaxID=143900 RepID=A0AAD7SR62_9TELE|nr:hypothetical protein AAFF_G00279530 [Aldrovandia affinis]